MNKLVTALVGLALVLSGAFAPSSAQDAADSKPSTLGEVGGFSFPKKGGATCVYKKGRLTAIKVAAPKASARAQWEPNGQWIRWGALLEAKGKSGGWKPVGKTATSSGNTWSEAKPVRAGALAPLFDMPALRVISDPDKQFRVVATILWYSNVGTANEQGRAFDTISSYKSGKSKVASCAGATTTKLPPLKSIANNELDAVNVSFAGRGGGGKTTYSVKKGTLPQGLEMSKKGVVKGRITAGAVNTTNNYKNIGRKAFSFKVKAKANGRTTTKKYSWTVYDTAFVMPNYYGLYGCGDCGEGPDEPKNISDLGPKSAFGCTTTPQPNIPPEKYSVVYRQDYQKADGTLAPSAGQTFRYGDLFKWWYYNASCSTTAGPPALEPPPGPSPVGLALVQVDNSGNVRSCGSASSPCSDVVKKFRTTITGGTSPATNLEMRAWRNVSGSWVESGQSPFRSTPVNGQSSIVFQVTENLLSGTWRFQTSVAATGTTQSSVSGFQYIAITASPPPADTSAPTITGASASHPGNESQYASFSLSATDNVGVTQMRAIVNGAPRSWVTYATSGTVFIDGWGNFGIGFQVRDAAGNESSVVFAGTVTRRAVVSATIRAIDNSGNLRSCGFTETAPCSNVVKKFRVTLSYETPPPADVLFKAWRKISGNWVETSTSPYMRTAISGGTVFQFTITDNLAAGLWRFQAQVPVTGSTQFGASAYQYMTF